MADRRFLSIPDDTIAPENEEKDDHNVDLYKKRKVSCPAVRSFLEALEEGILAGAERAS